MRIIENYGDSSFEIAGRSVCSSLAEDDDGIRVAIFETLESISAHHWSRAHADGALWLLAPSGSSWVGMTSEGFMSVREEHSATGTYRCNPRDFLLGEGQPSYRTLRTLVPASVAAMESPKMPEGFVHLHAHSEFSALDGLSTIQEMVDTIVGHGQHALAVTDHGRCAGHPTLQKVAKAAGIKPVFGIEANFTEDRRLRGNSDFAAEPDHLLNARRLLNDYRHLILWAENDQGLRNLWGMSTDANIVGGYGRPRMDWESVASFAEGVMCSTACLRGPIAQPLLNDDEDLARERLGRLMEIFPDRLWVELHCNQMPEQHKVNKALVSLASEYGLPLLAVVDSHYPCPEDQRMHKIWLATQTQGKEGGDTDDAQLFAGNQDYHLMREDEVRKNLAYLPADVVDEAIGQSAVVAQRCHAKIEGKTNMPVFSKPTDGSSAIQRDVERLVDICMANWHKVQVRIDEQPTTVLDDGTVMATEDVYFARFEREMRLLVDKGYCGYYLMVWDQVDFAKNRQNILVGPGRGSGGGSLVAYLSNITEIDPVEAGLMFERFLTEGRDSPPDFDVDYPTSKRDVMQDYCTERWGAEFTMRVGTHSRKKNKGILRTLVGVLKDDLPNFHYPDLDAIGKIIDKAEAGTAGMGLKWDDLWVEAGEELEPYRSKYPVLFETAGSLVKRLSTYGKHAAGMVITTDEPLTGRLPMRTSEKSHQPISEFDMKALEDLGLLKFDLLTLRTLDTLQMCLDLIHEQHGERIDVYAWRKELADPQVWDEVAEGYTLGIFQAETDAVTKLVKRFRPNSIADLADIITLVRPGPTRSGLTETYFRRKNGVEAIEFIDPRLEQILRPTYGCIIYQEQVMAACQVLAGYTLAEADEVRRMLGKKEVEKVQAAGEEFTQRCVERGMAQQVADDLWGQLGEFAKYSFNKSHAWAYAVIGLWTAWFKIHYPSQFLTAVLSTVESERIPEFVNEARRMGYKVLPPDINESGASFTPIGGVTVRYGFRAISGIGDAVCAAILDPRSEKPFESFEDFIERKGSKCDKGNVATLVRAGCFDSLVPNRRALESSLDWAASPDSTRCQHKDESVVLPHGLPCTFDWEGEPVELTPKGKPKKPKPPVKRCTRGCRNYLAPEADDFDGLPSYTDVEIRERERELLGIFLSSSPFDIIPDEAWEDLFRGSDVEHGAPGQYFVAATVEKVRQHLDRNQNEMGFLTLYAFDATLDVTVFKDAWARYKDVIVKDGLCVVEIFKNERGITLRNFQPL